MGVIVVCCASSYQSRGGEQRLAKRRQVKRAHCSGHCRPDGPPFLTQRNKISELVLKTVLLSKECLDQPDHFISTPKPFRACKKWLGKGQHEDNRRRCQRTTFFCAYSPKITLIISAIILLLGSWKLQTYRFRMNCYVPKSQLFGSFQSLLKVSFLDAA